MRNKTETSFNTVKTYINYSTDKTKVINLNSSISLKQKINSVVSLEIPFYALNPAKVYKIIATDSSGTEIIEGAILLQTNIISLNAGADVIQIESFVLKSDSLVLNLDKKHTYNASGDIVIADFVNPIENVNISFIGTGANKYFQIYVSNTIGSNTIITLPSFLNSYDDGLNKNIAIEITVKDSNNADWFIRANSFIINKSDAGVSPAELNLIFKELLVVAKNGVKVNIDDIDFSNISLEDINSYTYTLSDVKIFNTQDSANVNLIIT